ncbi:MAG: hypothetical protein HOW59_37080 [Nonomuraea sp.]|nr:hypothetical protein [Nonomuraea sp.]NUQ33272.1 hypothetical protein [Dermatophilaceae bacterium]NUR81090.1 hypothetical protein [Dermatophilaceae bacterium]
MSAVVDHRPHLERGAPQKIRAVLLGIAGCALLGGGLAATLVVHLTTPPKETP